MGVLQIRCSLLFLITKLYLLSIIPTTKSDLTYLYNFCTNSSSSNPNTKHQANLNTVFRSLSANDNASNPSGFFITSAGNATSDTVYGLFMCRGDQSATACHDCVSTATTTDLPKTYCPKGSQAIIWYDECMVRYSNESFFGKMDQSPRVFLINTQSPNGDKNKFTDLIGNMMDNLKVEATSGDKVGKKFAVNHTRFTSLNTLYGLAQCTPDLSRNDCDQCLTIAIGGLKIAQGARVLQPSCNVRYATYPFYNGASEVPAPPPATSNSTDKGNGPGPNIINSRSGKKKISAKVIAAIGSPLGVLSFVVLTVGICLIKRKAKYDAVATKNGQYFTSPESLQFDLATLQAATNNFSTKKKLGEGGFGGVYKGTLPNGQEIAVKRLSKTSGQGAKEFKNEVLVLAKLQHRNLVKLMGFCLAGEEKLLVYEYVANKSLDYFLFDPERQGQLDWGTRYKIIGGIARGMLYLHRDSRLRTIHRDLKASNVLLDADMNPKIADFGLARIVGVDQSQGSTSKIVGTYGYMSPEYAMQGQFSVKSDVYSFGVLVLEVISGKKNTNFYESGYAEDLLSYAWKQLRDGNPFALVDPTLRDSFSSNEAMRCIHLGLLCVQEYADERPTMATAVLMLESYSHTLPMPGQPAFFIKSQVESNFSIHTGSDISTTKSSPLSVNDVTITDIETR